MAIPIIVHKIFLNTAAAVSLCGNGTLLALLLLHQTSVALGSYRYLLVAFTVLDIYISVFHSWYIPMFILGEYGFVYYGHGCLYGKGLIARHANEIYATTFHLPFLLIGMHFMYRYFSLARVSLVREHFTRFLLAYTIYGTFYTVIIALAAYAATTLPMPAHFTGFLADYGIPHIREGMNVVPMDYLNSDSDWNIPVLSIVTVVGAVSFTPQMISIMCINKIVGTIDSRVIEIKVRRLHIQLFRALLLQFSTPFLFSFVPFTFCALLPATGRTFGIAGNMIAMSASLFPALDPILIILSVSRFRLALQQWADVIMGRTGRRNEMNALQQSRSHSSMIRNNTFLYSAFFVSLVGNGTLLALLVNKAGKALGNYRFLLAAFACTDIFISTFHMWYIPMFILGNFGFVYYGYGCLFGKNIIAIYSNIIYSSTFYLPFLLIGLHFIYRYLSLKRPAFVKDKFHIFVLCSSIYSIAFITSIVFLSHLGHNMGVSDRFSGYLAEYGIRRLNEDMNIDAIEYLDEDYNPRFRAMGIILAAGIVGGHSIVISIVCILKIFAAFHDRVFEIRVRRLHIQLFRSLLLQFSIPFVFSFLPFTAIVFLPATGISFGQAGNVCGLLASVFPALDPILMIVSINKFRSTIFKWLYRITGRRAVCNERKEMERSNAYAATLKQKTKQNIYKRVFFRLNRQQIYPNSG